MRSEWRDGERDRAVELTPLGPGHFRATVDGAAIELTVESVGDGRLRLTTGDQVTVAEVSAAGPRVFVRLGAMDFVLNRESAGRRRARAAGGGSLETPMPGVVTKVMVAPGAAVKRGQPLLAIEAMKMEHLIRAPHDGTVRAVAAEVGDMVAAGVPLVELDAPPEPGDRTGS
ncbi:MAG TPA: biotin/lipoyl-containing protein [Dongiaceae bacterium]|nr:biotin/lipoyl-containing protein [Dongiaceae bacterium]